MRPVFFIILFLCALGAGCLQAGEIYIDFGTASLTTQRDSDGRVWNNAVWGGAGHTSPLRLRDSDGKSTGLSLRRLGGFLGAFDSGNNPQDLYPNSAGGDRWSLEQGKTASGRLEISGFKPGETVDLFIFATRHAPVPFPTRYSVGGNSRTLNAQNNRRNGAILNNVSADASGRLTISVELDGGRNGHLGVLEIRGFREGSTATPVPASPPKPQPKPEAKPQPEAAPDPAVESERERQLRELGLEETESSGIFLFGGILMIVLGLAIIGVSVWYYLRPEPVETETDDEPETEG